MPVAYIRDQNAAESSCERLIPYTQQHSESTLAHIYRPSSSGPSLLRKDGINRRKEAKGAPVTPASVERGQNRWHNLASAKDLVTPAAFTRSHKTQRGAGEHSAVASSRQPRNERNQRAWWIQTIFNVVDSLIYDRYRYSGTVIRKGEINYLINLVWVCVLWVETVSLWIYYHFKYTFHANSVRCTKSSLLCLKVKPPVFLRLSPGGSSGSRKALCSGASPQIGPPLISPWRLWHSSSSPSFSYALFAIPVTNWSWKTRNLTVIRFPVYDVLLSV